MKINNISICKSVCPEGECQTLRYSTRRVARAAEHLKHCAMEESRSSSPIDPPQDLWSSILDSVSSSRSIPAKQVILLGEPSSGKSTIAAALLKETKSEKETPSDFAVGYDWADVKDEAEEGITPLPS